jgi:stage III sporulation protein AA
MNLIYGWNELIGILPAWLAREVDKLRDLPLQELRLRLSQKPQLILADRIVFLEQKIQRTDLDFCINTATKYSPWAAASIADGYIAAPGGHRIGLCGDAVGYGADMRGQRNIRSLCIRIAGDFPGIATPLMRQRDSILLIGRPGTGKTTLLRDLIRQISALEQVCVVDQRGELFPPCFPPGERMDVITGCEKDRSIDILLRTMNPDTIAMDEITKPSDCAALTQAAWCGVRLIATAHAGSREELFNRPVYGPILDSGIFHTLVILSQDKTWRCERM